MNTGTIFSGIGHAGLILWVLVGDWLFPAKPTEEIIVTSVSMVTSAEFDAMQAAATLKPAEETAPVKPQPRPEEVTPPEEVVPEEPTPVEPPPTPEPPPVEEPPPAEEVVPVEPPPSDAPQAEEEQAILSESTEIQPAPEAEAIIAPDPVQPETDTATSDTATPAVTEDPAAAEVVPQDPTEATAPEDTGDVTLTEANAEQSAETGMTTSIRPKSRPEKPAPAPEPDPVEVAADVPAETPPEDVADQPVDDTATEDAIASLLDEAADAPATEETAADTGGQDLPQGPPMSGSEKDSIVSAVNRCWNIGNLSTAATRVRLVVRVEMSEDGKPDSVELVEFSNGDEAAANQAFQAAKRAIIRSVDGCSGGAGLSLDPAKYGQWNVINFTIDASKVALR